MGFLRKIQVLLYVSSRSALSLFLMMTAVSITFPPHVAFSGIEGNQEATHYEILQKLSTPSDGKILTLQQGSTEPDSSVKIQIKDKNGNVVASISADGTINIQTGANYKINNTALTASDVDAEPTISAGTAGQYYRGDKSWQTLNPTAVGAEPTISAGTTLQYWRGDKTWQSLSGTFEPPLGNPASNDYCLISQTNGTRSWIACGGSGAVTSIFTRTGAVVAATGDYASFYPTSAGLSGGQTLKGGTGSGDDLTLFSTNHATKGNIFFGTSTYDEANNRMGIDIAAPATPLDVNGNGTVRGSMLITGTLTIGGSAP